MRKLLLASTVLAGMTAVAAAADLPRRAEPPPVFTPVPVFTWTGFYAGFNVGYAFDTGRQQGNAFVIGPPFAPAGTIATFRNDSQDGFTGGGQIGYNWQLTPGSGVVFGIEADAQYLDFGRDRRAAVITGGPLAAGFSVVDPRGLSSLDFFGTVRGRLGYAFDRILVYGTGGFAYGSGSTDRSFGGFNGNDDFRTGWAAGGGVEWALANDSFLNFFRSSAVTFKIEGLYVSLDRGTRGQGAFIISNATNTPVVFNAVGQRDDEFAVVRAGVNYKFGSY
ncbi:hypothetical protein NBEOAGPD_2214 [Methylobacterium gregans]|uniref:Porin n=1 Tax=Methylobacterium gregans TaxID=374424 RepID=A0AA37HNE4_9HYPH|nr:outer membrane beta-barrel protein [Methylobacterium gregans]MDQ0523716.1 outer membrane immunogenic protein [Methylobacterium gregans]GJD78994.1 hypothetical protein NBEOAGPD_2214 [Methylobacterium gregans]